MTQEILITLSSAVISVGFEYIPGLRDWYNQLVDTKQRLIMLLIIFVLNFGAFGLGCIDWLNVYPCTKTGLFDAIQLFCLSIAVNQGTFSLLPKWQK